MPQRGGKMLHLAGLTRHLNLSARRDAYHVHARRCSRIARTFAKGRDVMNRVGPTPPTTIAEAVAHAAALAHLKLGVTHNVLRHARTRPTWRGKHVDKHDNTRCLRAKLVQCCGHMCSLDDH